MRRNLNFIVVCLLCLFVVAPVMADFYTPIGGSGEENFPVIANTIYGTTFTASGLDYIDTVGSIKLTRMVDSTDDNPLNVGGDMNVVVGPASGATDQIWDDGATKIYAKARFASYAQDFGYWTAGGSVWNPLFSVDPGYGQTGQASPDLTGLHWAWGRQGTTMNSSYADDNEDNQDHMLTYQVTGLPGQGSWNVWLLRWDDQTTTCYSDRDFNDMVVEIWAVPVPGAVLLGLIGIGAAGMKLRRFA